jgi:hypothetical protein
MPSHPHVPGCARLNVMRLNAARLNFYEAVPLAIVGGVDRTSLVRIAGASVEHVLNDAPDTARVRVHGFVPTAGETFQLFTGDRALEQQLFGGRILETTRVYESLKTNTAFDIRAIDLTWLLNRRRVLATYTGWSASTIVLDVIARFASGVTTGAVTNALPIIDAITFTNETVATCLTAICERIGAYWYVDYAGVLHVFVSEGPDAAPITQTDARTSSDHALAEDLSQVVTRVIARGGGGQALVDVAAGATEVPVTDDAWYSTAGGIVEVGAQRVTYAGVKGRGGTGAIVGTLTTPTAALKAAVSHGTGLAAGTYRYAQTLTNASGETLPGPQTAATAGAAVGTLWKTWMRDSGRYSWPGDGMTPGGLYSWRVHVLLEGGGFVLGPPTDYYVGSSTEWEIYLGMRVLDPVTGHWYNNGIMTSGPARIIQTVVNRTRNGGSTWYAEYHWDGEGVGASTGWMGIPNTYIDGDLNLPYPTGPVAALSKVTVSGLEQAAGGFSGVKLYRTAANGAQLKLLATNPTVPYVDTVTDAALGANAPTTDTAQVPTSNARVPVGSTTLTVSSTQPFVADGDAGWAQIGTMLIQYTGTGAGLLTGIPAAGVGSLTATVQYGAQVLVVPRLVGVAGLTRALTAGDAITLRVELDDAAAQAALGSRLGGTAADGIVEEVFSDSRMTTPELLNYARALLLERKDPRLTLTFVTRDPTVEVGRLITVTLSQPPIAGIFRIQRIRFDEIAITGGLARVGPRRTVEASNKLYTFADLLRRLRGREGGAS